MFGHKAISPASQKKSNDKFSGRKGAKAEGELDEPEGLTDTMPILKLYYL